MDSQLSAFLLGLVTGISKVGFIGFAAVGLGWWQAHKKIKRLEAAGPDPNRLEERLASLERASDYTASQVERLVEAQAELARVLTPQPSRPALAPERPDPQRPTTPH